MTESQQHMSPQQGVEQSAEQAGQESMSTSAATAASTAAGLDDILAQLDSVMNTNAAAFVEGFVQKGGE